MVAVASLLLKAAPYNEPRRDHCHHMAAINITEQAAAAPDFEVYNCHENHLLHLNLGAGVNRDAA